MNDYIRNLASDNHDLTSLQKITSDDTPVGRLSFVVNQILLLLKNSVNGLDQNVLVVLLRQPELYFFMPVMIMKFRDLPEVSSNLEALFLKLLDHYPNESLLFKKNIYLFLTYLGPSVKSYDFFKEVLKSDVDDLICLNKVIIQDRNSVDRKVLDNVHSLCIRRMNIFLTEREQVFFERLNQPFFKLIYKFLVGSILERDLVFSSIALVSAVNVNDIKNSEKIRKVLERQYVKHLPGSIPSQTYSFVASALAYASYKQGNLQEYRSIIKNMEKNPIENIYDFLLEQYLLDFLIEENCQEEVVEYIQNRSGEKMREVEFEQVLSRVKTKQRVF